VENQIFRGLLSIGQRRARSMEPGSVDHGPDRRHALTGGEVILLVNLAAIIRTTDGTGRLFGHRYPCGVSPISRSRLHRRLLDLVLLDGFGPSDLAAGASGRVCIRHAKEKRCDLHPAAARMT